MIELVKIDKSTLDSETLDFSPITYTDCDFHGPFKIEYYLVSSYNNADDAFKVNATLRTKPHDIDFISGEIYEY